MRERILSLDVFRGATVALMILVNNPGSWSHLFPPLAHAPWHGCTPTDLVFPFFLFAVGNALACVMPGYLAATQPGASGVFWRKVATRTALIFAIGLFLNASPFVRWDVSGQLVPKAWDALRIMGVLQRIALCWGAAAVLVWWARGQPRQVAAMAALLLLGYWAACVALGQSGDPYSLTGYFGTSLDRNLLGPAHLYQGEGQPFDPEGLASTLPAVAQVLLGYLAGLWLVNASTGAAGLGSGGGLGVAAQRVVIAFFVSATALLVLAYAWHLAMPFNKKLWTSSYVLLTTGWALLALACLMVVLARRPVGHMPLLWVRVLDAFGKNALFVFVLSGFLPRVLALLRWSDGTDAQGLARFITPLPWVYRGFFAPLASDPRWGSFLFACANLSFYAALAWWLDRRRIYIKV